MKKSNPVQNNGLRDEYDFASMKGGVRGKYVRRCTAADGRDGDQLT